MSPKTDIDGSFVPNLDEIIFEHRNKEYGSFYLRKIYNKHLIQAFIIAAILLLITVVAPIIARQVVVKREKKIEKTVEVQFIKAPAAEEKELTPPPPPPPSAPVQALENVARFTIPVVVDTVVEQEESGMAISEDAEKAVTAGDGPPTNIEYQPSAGPTENIIEEKKEEVFMIVEEMPEFPGGDLALRQFISKNVKYPALARENDIKGKVYIRFVVKSNGEVDQVQVARGVHQLLDEEAIRVVKLLPRWKPGKQRGTPVSVWFTVPINFALQ